MYKLEITIQTIAQVTISRTFLEKEHGTKDS